MATRRRWRSKAARNALARLDRSLDVQARGGMDAYWSCARKARYGSERVALAVCRERMAAGAPDLRAYRCEWCGGWHITHVPLERRAGEGGADGRG